MSELVSDSPLQPKRPTWAEISLPALAHNFQTLKALLADGTQLMAVVKANAYGHGAVACAKALEAAGADWFGVALVEEGVELRESGISKPIFCLGGGWRTQGELILKHELTPALFRLDLAEELDALAKANQRVIKFHLKVDTGMGRLGIPWTDVEAFAQQLQRFSQLRLDGVLTHFAAADAATSDYTDLQIARYQASVATLRALGFTPTWFHQANSAGLHAYSQAQGNLARAGAAMYGLVSDVLSPRLTRPELQPVMSLRSRIVMLKTVPAGTSLGYGCTFTTSRESRIATLPIGYADGLRRAHSNQGRIIIRGKFAPIVGRVSMDLTIVDVTDVPGVELGDIVTLLGAQDGLCLRAEELAAQIGTISYEIVTGISARVPRVHITA